MKSYSAYKNEANDEEYTDTSPLYATYAEYSDHNPNNLDP